MKNDPPQAAEPVRVARVDRGLLTIRTTPGELRRVHHDNHLNDPPAVGDHVLLDNAGERVTAVLPRTSVLQRRASGGRGDRQVLAANVDVALLCEPLSGSANARRVERLVLLARAGGIEPIVVLTKTDLAGDLDQDMWIAERAAPGVRVVAISVATEPDAARAVLASCIAANSVGVLLGPSGAGKSTLTNLLVGEVVQLVREIRDSGYGRHTTTASSLLALPDGGLLVDTPGVRELGLSGVDSGDVDDAFPEIATLVTQCRFGDCSHTVEPGCAIVTAVALDKLDQARVDSWRKLQREADHERARTDERFRRERNAERKRMYAQYTREQRRSPKRGR